MSTGRFETFTLAAPVSDLDGKSGVDAADVLEFRMDHASEPLEQLASYAGDLPIIATNRASWEGGDAPDGGRIEALCTAAEHPHVAAVDIELASVRDGDAEGLREIATSHDTELIVSIHDFEATPALSQLRGDLKEATEWGDVGKLAVTAQTLDDVLDVLQVTRELSRVGRPVATMCMGDIGRHSRIVAPIYGSKIGYAPIDPSDATAPGQFPLDDMKRLIETLRG